MNYAGDLSFIRVKTDLYLKSKHNGARGAVVACFGLMWLSGLDRVGIYKKDGAVCWPGDNWMVVGHHNVSNPQDAREDGGSIPSAPNSFFGTSEH